MSLFRKIETPEIAKFFRKHAFKHRGTRFHWTEDMKPFAVPAAEIYGAGVNARIV